MFSPDTSIANEPWWVSAVAGVISVLFGLLALSWPGLTLFVLVWLFGFYAIFTGIVELVGMFRTMGEHRPWWTHLLLGVVGIAAGLLAFAYPGVTATVLLFVMAFWAIAIGIVEWVSSFSSGQFLLLVASVISILLGLLLLTNPLVGALAYVTVIGLFAIVRGGLLIIQAFRVPSWPPTT